jgi:hypothetical protein
MDIKDKIKKLTEALYRVTDLYPDREPLKWTLRELSLDIYANIMSIMSNKKSKPLKDNLDSMSDIINILELASLGGFISDINFGILKREYVGLKSWLENKKEESILEIKTEQEKPALVQNNKKTIGHSNGHSIGHKGQNERKQKIYDFLKREGEKTTKEIALNFEDISEKSIQRDLLEMVKSGELRAEGEKRWRIYSVAE